MYLEYRNLEAVLCERRIYLRWPTFESRDRKKSQHRLGNVIEMKTLLLPVSLFYDRPVNITVFKFQISTPGKDSLLQILNAWIRISRIYPRVNENFLSYKNSPFIYV